MKDTTIEGRAAAKSLGRSPGWTRKGIAVLCLFGLALVGCSQQNKAARHISRGDAHVKSGALPQAALEYKSALILDRSNRTAIIKLGRVFQAEGDNLLFWQCMVTARRLDTNDLATRVLFGRAALEMGVPSTAREEALYVLNKEPANEEALLLLVDTFRPTGQTNPSPEAGLIADRLKAAQQAGAAGRADFQIAQGNFRFRLRDFAGAEAAYRQAVVLDPKNGRAHWGIGTVLGISNDLKQAETALKPALELLPWRSPERILYANLKLATRQIEEARDTLKEVTRRAPDYLPAQLRLAELALAEKDYDTCEAIIERMTLQSPSYMPALLLRVQLARARGQPARALAELDKIRAIPGFATPLVNFQLGVVYLENTNITEAVRCLNTVVGQYRGNYDSVYYDAIFLLSDISLMPPTPDVNRALGLLTELYRQPDLARNPAVFKQTALRLNNLYQMQRDSNAVETLCLNLVKTLPQDPDGWFRLGEIQKYMKKYPEARQSYTRVQGMITNQLLPVRKLVELDLLERNTNAALTRAQEYQSRNPRSAAPLMLLADVQLLTAQTNLAQASLERAIELDPTNAAPAYGPLAQFYVANGKSAEAVERLRDLLSKYPKEPSALTNLNANALNVYCRTFMQIAAIQEATKDYAAACATYEKLLDALPRYFPALNNVAYLYAERLGDPAKALTFARRARAVNGADPAIADTLGWILYRLREYAEALPLIQQSAKAETMHDNAEVHYHLGMTYSMVGNEGEARDSLQRALETLRSQATRPSLLFSQDKSWQPEAEARLRFLNVGATADLRPAELERQLAQQPGDLILVNRLATAYERDAQWAKAIQLYRTAIQANPKTAEPLVVRLALACEQAGQSPQAEELLERVYTVSPTNGLALAQRLSSAYEAKGAVRQAVEVFERLNRAGGDSLEIRLSLARLYGDRMGDAKKAFEFAKRARDLAPRNPAVGALLGRLAYRNGDVEWAATLLAESARALPNQPDLWLDLALAQYAVGQTTEASQGAAQAARAAGPFPRLNEAKLFVRFASALTNVAQLAPLGAELDSVLKTNADFLPARFAQAVLLEQSDPAKAVTAYESIVAQYPLFHPARRNLGLRLAAQEATANRALDLLGPVRARDPNDAAVAKALGSIQLRRKNTGPAIQMFEDARRAGINDAEIYYLLGLAYELQPNLAQARTNMQKAVQLGLKGPQLQDAQRVLQAKN